MSDPRLINLQFGTDPLVVHAHGRHHTKPHWPAIKSAFFSSPARSLGPVEDLTLITCNNGHEAMGLFERSCEHLGVPYRVFGAGVEPWVNAKHKPVVLRDALASIETRYVMYVDSRDAILFGSPHELLDRYRTRFDAAMVFGGDRMHWPPCTAFKEFELGLPKARDSDFHYLNGGCWIGETSYCHAFFVEACATPPVPEAPESEQGILRQLFPHHHPRVQLDYRCELFQNIGFVVAEIFELVH
jgi:hypothetical protein